MKAYCSTIPMECVTIIEHTRARDDEENPGRVSSAKSKRVQNMQIERANSTMFTFSSDDRVVHDKD